MNQSAFARITVSGLCGSLTPNSATRRALDVALSGAAGLGVRTQVLELRDFELPFAGAANAGDYADVARLSSLLKASDGILWATPEYHGSYSGPLKNALDLMGFDEFRGKMIGLIGVAGGSTGAINALTHLRTVGRQLHAWVLPQQVSIARVQNVFDAQGTLTDADIERRLHEIGRQVARFACLHSTEAEEFLRDWEASEYQTTGDE